MEQIHKFEKKEKRELFAPLVKSNSKFGYSAVLTHTGVDRDDEVVGKAFMEKAAKERYLPALMDHENKALGQVAKWENRRVVKAEDGEHAFMGDPYFFMDNPSAAVLKKMLDDGAEFGISITAIPHEYDFIKKDGKKIKRWTDGEILTADFVGIPAHKHAMAAAVSKSFSFDKNKEGKKLTPEEKAELRKEITAEVDEKVAEVKKSLDEFKEGFKGEVEAVVKAAAPDLKKFAEDVDKKLDEKTKVVEKSLEDSRAEMLKKLDEGVPNNDPPKPDEGGGDKPGARVNKFIQLQKRTK